jgi:hypothetical protein
VGYEKYTPGGYTFGTHVDTRAGYAITGPRLADDISTLAGGYAVRYRVVHNGVNWVAASDGTNTKVYRVETGAWAVKLTVASAVCTDLFSFTDASGNVAIVVALGSSTAFRYSLDNGSTWVTSTLTGSKKYIEKALVQTNGLLSARVAYVVNPNTLYFGSGIINGSTIDTGSTVGDANSTDDAFTSLAEADGLLLIGKLRALYTITTAGVVSLLAGPYPLASTDAGAASTSYMIRRNFEYPVKGLDGSVYYPVTGYKVFRYYQGTWSDISPGRYGPNVPNLNLPVTALTYAHGYLLVALGSEKVETIRTQSYSPSGGVDVTAAGSLPSADNISTCYVFAGREEATPNGLDFVWHGSLLRPSYSNPANLYIQFMWFDASASAVNIAITDGYSFRFYWEPSAPAAVVPTTYSSYPTNYGLTLELGMMDGRTPFLPKTGTMRWRTTGLLVGGGSPSAANWLRVSCVYFTQYGDLNAAPAFDAEYTTPILAERQVQLPPSKTFRQLNVLLTQQIADTPAPIVLWQGELTMWPVTERMVNSL